MMIFPGPSAGSTCSCPHIVDMVVSIADDAAVLDLADKGSLYAELLEGNRDLLWLGLLLLVTAASLKVASREPHRR